MKLTQAVKCKYFHVTENQELTQLCGTDASMRLTLKHGTIMFLDLSCIETRLNNINISTLNCLQSLNTAVASWCLLL